MSIKIKIDQIGDDKYVVTSIKGLLTRDALPESFRVGGNHCFADASGRICIFFGLNKAGYMVERKGIPFYDGGGGDRSCGGAFLEVGRGMTRKALQWRLRMIKKCGDRLHRYNKRRAEAGPTVLASFEVIV